MSCHVTDEQGYPDIKCTKYWPKGKFLHDIKIHKKRKLEQMRKLNTVAKENIIYSALKAIDDLNRENNLQDLKKKSLLLHQEILKLNSEVPNVSKRPKYVRSTK
jgi:hypothetical protein